MSKKPDFRMPDSSAIDLLGEEEREFLRMIMPPVPKVTIVSSVEPKHIRGAILSGDFEGIKYILEHIGFNLNQNIADRPEHSYTALSLAVTQRNLKIVQLLIRNNANLDARDHFGRTALHATGQLGLKEIARELIIAGASTDISDSRGFSPAYYALDSGRFDVYEEILKGPRFEIERMFPDGSTLLQLAIVKASAELVETTIRAGASSSHLNQYGGSPLEVATRHKKLDAIKALIANGVDINYVNRSGDTAIFFAIEKNDKDLARFLVKNGIRIDEFHRVHHKTPLVYAILLNNTEMVKILLEAGARTDIGDDRIDMSALHIAISEGNDLITKMIIDKGANLRSADSIKGYSPLHLASKMNYIYGVHELIKAGADIDQKDKEGNTPLHIALFKKNPIIFSLLLNCGAKFDLKNIDNKSVIDIALENRDKATLNQILAKMAKDSGEEAEYPDALRTAIKLGEIELAKKLVKAGYDPCVKARDHLSAMDIAKEMFGLNIADLYELVVDDLSREYYEIAAASLAKAPEADHLDILGKIFF